MVKDILEKAKKEAPGSLIPGRGGCKFCGQITALEVSVDWTEAMCDELATELCECAAAQDYTVERHIVVSINNKLKSPCPSR